MSIKAILKGLSVVTALLALSSINASAETPREQAIGAGAQQLTSDEIADRIVGKTVTFESGGKTFLVHYGEDNVVSGELVGGDWSDTGYYGITTGDRVCLSWNESDHGRLRCMTVLEVNGAVKKFNADGSFFGDLVSFQEGKAF